MGVPATTMLLDLVTALRNFTTSGDEIAATSAFLVNHDTVRLGSTFAGASIDVSPEACAVRPSLPPPPRRTETSYSSGTALSCAFAGSSPGKPHCGRGEKRTGSRCDALQGLLRQKHRSRGPSYPAITRNFSASYRSKKYNERRKEGRVVYPYGPAGSHDRPFSGVRCSTRSLICTVKGDLPRNNSETEVYTLENLGRLLILLEGNRGFLTPVFPSAIELPREGREILPKEAQSYATTSIELNKQLCLEACRGRPRCLPSLPIQCSVGMNHLFILFFVTPLSQKPDSEGRQAYSSQVSRHFAWEKRNPTALERSTIGKGAHNGGYPGGCS